jgi:hypothetical protein
MADRKESTILEDVEKDGDVLLLADGRRLQVSPADATAASIWMYGARLTLCAVPAGGRRGPSTLSVTNEDTGETIRATLRSGRKPPGADHSGSPARRRGR